MFTFKSVIFSIVSRKKVTNKSDELSDSKNIDDDEFSVESASIIQVVMDDMEGKFRPVINGYKPERMNNKAIIKFRITGEYLFQLEDHPKNPPPVKIKVVEEQPLSLMISDDGFLPRIVRIGNFF